jgi:hypothetical protein
MSRNTVCRVAGHTPPGAVILRIELEGLAPGLFAVIKLISDAAAGWVNVSRVDRGSGLPRFAWPPEVRA